jgi:hypothetical protein
MSVTFITKLISDIWNIPAQSLLPEWFGWCWLQNMSIYIPMQSRDNDTMLQFRVQCSIYNHEHDVLWRCMIAMMVQHEDGGFHARPKWCIWHNAITMMLAQWCIHHDARMTMLAMYARKKCIKCDAYHDEWMMHMTHTLQPFSHN